MKQQQHLQSNQAVDALWLAANDIPRKNCKAELAVNPYLPHARIVKDMRWHQLL